MRELASTLVAGEAARDADRHTLELAPRRERQSGEHHGCQGQERKKHKHHKLPISGLVNKVGASLRGVNRSPRRCLTMYD